MFIRSPLKTKQYSRQSPSIIGHIILGLGILSLGLGTMVFIQLTDPYSIFGRIITDLFKPAIAGINNGIVSILKQFNLYSVDFIRIHDFDIPTLITAILMFLLVGTFAVLRGRLFCNTVCPVGALLRLISFKPLFSVVVEDNRCTSCGICSRVCRAGCIDLQEKRPVDSGRCVVCFDCIDRCPHGALRFTRTEREPMVYKTDPQRREFLKGGAMLAGSTAIGLTVGSATNPGKSTVFGESDGQNGAVIPPGGKSMEHYVSACIACHRCVSVCPTRVLRPSFTEFGLRGVMVPVMDYHGSFCEYECTKCNHVCPTGALRPLPLEKKKLTKLGTVALIEDRCIVFDKHEECGACAEVCPTHAVTTERRNLLHYPVINEGPCIGCGSCEHACPVAPKAIFVEAALLHGTAEKPFEKESGPATSQERSREDTPEESQERSRPLYSEESQEGRKAESAGESNGQSGTDSLEESNGKSGAASPDAADQSTEQKPMQPEDAGSKEFPF